MPTLAETWEKRGLQQGLEKGRQEGRQKEAAYNVLVVLEARFGSVPEALAQHIKTMDDLAKLRELSKLAATASSLDVFREMVTH